MQSNRPKRQPRPKRHLGQKLVILFGSLSLFGSGLAIPLQGANAQAKEPLENNFTEIPIVDSPVVSASEPLAAPVLTIPEAPVASEQILRTMQESSSESIAREQVPVLINPVDNFADSNDYGLAARPRNLGNPAANESRPDTIVLNERSTGCAKVLVNGAVPDQICPITELAPSPLAMPSPPTIANFPTGVQPVSVFGMEVRPGGFRLASNSSADKTSSNFFSRNRPVGRPGAGRGTFMFPLTIPSVITSIFGWRVHPISGGYRFHSGTDLGADQGTPVIAVTDGKVATADYLGGYGFTVILRHENNTQESLYAHLSQILVQPGEEVTQGTVIGLVGSTGNSTGPHLHFEWRTIADDGWVAVDPTAHLQFALEQFMIALENPTAKPLFSRLPNAE